MPGIVVALVLAAWRYGLTLTVSPAVVPALLLSSLMATSVGFAITMLIARPVVTNAVVNALVFVVLIFSPIQFPIGRLPLWLADVHRVLPVYYLGQVIRASLTTGIVTNTALSYVMLTAWTMAAWAGTAWVVGRRR